MAQRLELQESSLPGLISTVPQFIELCLGKLLRAYERHHFSHLDANPSRSPYPPLLRTQMPEYTGASTAGRYDRVMAAVIEIYSAHVVFDVLKVSCETAF